MGHSLPSRHSKEGVAKVSPMRLRSYGRRLGHPDLGIKVQVADRLIIILELISSYCVPLKSIFSSAYWLEAHFYQTNKVGLGVILEPLKAIRSSLGKEYAEYKYLSSTIDILEKISRPVIVLEMCYIGRIRTMID